MILNKKKRAVPYAIYIANGSIGLKDKTSQSAELICMPGFSPALAYLDDYLKEIESYISMRIPSGVVTPFLNGLFVSTFSILELFLSDFLLCGVFSDEENYLRASSVCCRKIGVSALEMENTIRRVISSKVFHRLDDIALLFRSVLEISFPDTDQLKRLVHKRHNIVHRYVLSSIDRMTVCDAKEDDIIRLIQEIRVLASALQRCVLPHE